VHDQLAISKCDSCDAETRTIVGVWDEEDQQFHHTEKKYYERGLGYKGYK